MKIIGMVLALALSVSVVGCGKPIKETDKIYRPDTGGHS